MSERLNQIDFIQSDLAITSKAGVERNVTAEFASVVSVCQDECQDNVGCPYIHVPLADDEQSAERWGGSTEYSEFERAADAVLARLAFGKVLVHCHSGQNRSAAVCAAVRAVDYGVTFEKALDDVRGARPVINPNDMFKAHARRYVEENSVGSFAFHPA